MKAVYITIIALLSFIKGYSQDTLKPDSAVNDLKTYFKKQTRFPAITMENHIQGAVVVDFKIDDKKNITDIHVIKPLVSECDAEVLRVLRLYNKPILLPPAEYTAAITFSIEDGKNDNQVVTFDKSNYQNFLFVVDIIAIFNH